jgi:hypothetical protein
MPGKAPEDVFAHVQPSVRHLAAADDETRLRAIITDAWLTYPAGEMVVSRLFELVRMPRRLRMPSLLVYAPPNSGKSRIIRRFLDLYQAEVVGEVSDPGAVVSIQAPPTVDEKRLYMEILRSLQASTPDATVARLRSMVVRQLETRKAQLLTIDEMQHIFDQRPAARQVVLNTFKYLSNELGLAIAGFGSGEARALIQSDAHLAERFEVIGLPAWGRHQWVVDLVRQRVALLPLRQETTVDRAFMNALRDVCHEAGGRMLHHLERCAKAAIQSGEERITRELIEGVATHKERVEHAF